MADGKPSGLENLKKLVYKGFLTKVVEIESLKITMKTLSMQEEFDVMEAAGLENLPGSARDMLKYIPAVLARSVIKVDDEPVTKEQMTEILKGSNAPKFVSMLYAAYMDLENQRAEAGAEIKNSSATPTPNFIG